MRLDQFIVRSDGLVELLLLGPYLGEEVRVRMEPEEARMLGQAILKVIGGEAKHQSWARETAGRRG